MENKKHHPVKHDSDDTTLLRIVGALMCVASIPYFLFGIPLSLLLIGIPIVILGGALLYFGMQVYRLKKGSDVGAMVVLGINVLFSSRMGWWPLLALAGIYLIYTNRHRFVN